MPSWFARRQKSDNDVKTGAHVNFEAGSELQIAGTAVTASADELNKLRLMTATTAELNNVADVSGFTVDGYHPLLVAVATFDATVAGNQAQGAHGLSTVIPANSLIMGGWVDVNTHFHSAGDTATIAIHVEGANDIISAAAVSGAPYSSIGRKAILPKINTPENAADVKTTVQREITATVAVQDLTDGKLTVYIVFMPCKASA